MPVAGDVRLQGRYGGAGAYGGGGAANAETNNHAQAVTDYDFGVDEDEEIKYEIVSHTCAQSVKNARMDAAMTQTALAILVNEKPQTIIDVENGTARYNADLINRIERALNARIDRGRKGIEKQARGKGNRGKGENKDSNIPGNIGNQRGVESVDTAPAKAVGVKQILGYPGQISGVGQVKQSIE